MDQGLCLGRQETGTGPIWRKTSQIYGAAGLSRRFVRGDPAFRDVDYVRNTFNLPCFRQSGQGNLEILRKDEIRSCFIFWKVLKYLHVWWSKGITMLFYSLYDDREITTTDSVNLHVERES